MGWLPQGSSSLCTPFTRRSFSQPVFALLCLRGAGGGSQADQEGLPGRGTLHTQQNPCTWLQSRPFHFLGMRTGSARPVVSRRGSPSPSPRTGAHTVHSVTRAQLTTAWQSRRRAERAAVHTERALRVTVKNTGPGQDAAPWLSSCPGWSQESNSNGNALPLN